MSQRFWPLPALRLKIGQLELRLPDRADLEALALLAFDGVHDPQVQPFAEPWTDAEPTARALGTLQYHWSSWGSWRPDNWSLGLVVVRDGTVLGTQNIGAREFARLREVGTGSWLGRQYQGQGVGTAMRAAVLALAFDGLGAHFATSGAFEDNPASMVVSRKLGYAEDGFERHLIRGRPAVMRRLRLDRQSWQAHRTSEVTISGLEPCLPLFGLPGPD